MEHIEMNNSSDSKLHFESICSIRIRSRNGDIVEKLKRKMFFDDVLISRKNSNETHIVKKQH